ncbi:MAG: serine/threonine-protein kinase [Myxococcota bacterium]
MADARRYHGVSLISSGGMGTVELAVRREESFRRLYAVKRLKELYRDDATMEAMFLDEARIAGLLRHPNIVSVLDFGRDDRGPFLVMDYVHGLTAQDLLRRAETAPIPVQICVRLIRDVAEALHAAHELRTPEGTALELVHRDVSPQNILVGFDGVPRLSDFGIAKAFDRLTQTTTGLLKGKAGYMTPEQLRFDTPDRRSDLFSLGVVLFELLAGCRLYRDADPAATAKRILHQPAPDIDDYRSAVPPSLVDLLFQLLAKDPDERPPTARDVSRQLDGVLAELTMVEDPYTLTDYLEEHCADVRRTRDEALRSAEETRLRLVEDTEATRPPTSRSGWFAVGISALLLVGGIGAFFGVRSASSRPTAVEKLAPSTPAVVELATVDREPVVLEDEALPIDTVDPIDSVEPMPGAVESDAQDAPAMSRRPRRGPVRPRPASPMSMTEVPTVPWIWGQD